MIRANLTGRGYAGALVVAFAVLAIGTVQAQSRGELWKLESDGSWQAETVALGNDGTQVFAEHGAYINSKILLSGHDSNPPSPVWTDVDNLLNFHRFVDSARRADVHATMHLEVDDGGIYRTAVLKRYSSGAEEPDWTYEFGLSLGDQKYNEVRVSDDGQRITAAVFDGGGTNKTHVAVFEGSSATPTSYTAVDTHTPFEGWAVSGDGSTAVFRSNLKLVVFDLDASAVIHDEFIFSGTFNGGIGLSGDGSLLAVNCGSTVALYERQGNGYTQTAVHSLPSGGHCRRLSISRDGSTLALAVNFFGQASRVDVQALDTATGTLTVNYSITGSGSYTNMSSGVETSDDGAWIAVGLWGDEHQTVPELLVFQDGSDAPVWSYDLPGSVMDLGFSHDGRHLAAAVKGAHANDFGGGGSFRFFEVREQNLVLNGVPSIGETVTFEQDLPGGNIARVICSPALDPNPVFYAGIGTLHLQRCPEMTFLPHGTQNGNGVFETLFTIPNDPNLIGTTSYFQGLGLSPRGLSDNYVKVTVLP